MKIVITSAHAHEGETGSALIAEILAKQLSKTNEVLYLRLGTKYHLEKKTKNLTYLYLPSSDVNGIIVPDLSKETVVRIYKQLDNFKPDIVHAENIIFGGLLALTWAKERKVPAALTLHHIPHEGLMFVFPEKKKNKLFTYVDNNFNRGYTKTIVDQADVVIALTQVIVDSLKILKLKTKYKIINNGIELDSFKKLKIVKPKDEVHFIYPGSYIARKNQEYLVNVFRYLPDNYILNLYGSVKTGYYYIKTLEKLIKKYNIKNVRIHDYEKGDNLLTKYSKSHYLISASVKEVQSLVIIEALASGKPVIALENETTKELTNSDKFLVLSQNTTPKSFAQKTLKYVKNTNKNYSKIAAWARNHVENFDVKKVALRHLELYKETIKEQKEGVLTKRGGLLLLRFYLGGMTLVGFIGRVASKYIKLKASIFHPSK